MEWTLHLLLAPEFVLAVWPFAHARLIASNQPRASTSCWASPRDRVPVAIEMDSRLVVHERVKGSPLVATHRRLHPRGELRERCALVAALVQQNKAARACRKVGAQHFEEPSKRWTYECPPAPVDG
jgi:hypothetical protein